MKPALTLFAIGLTALVAGGFWLASELMPLFDDPYDNRPFSQSIWLAHHNDWDANNPRGEMVKDLTNRLIREKPLRAEVLELLGEPEYSTSDNRLSYNIGAWHFIRIDYDSLDIHFDESLHVTKVEVVQR